MNDNTPIIHAISRTQHEPKEHYSHASTHHTNPFTIDVITDNGEVNLVELHTLQDQLLQPTPINYFKPYRHQYFHIDTGANVHATTDKRDFLIYYHHRRSINIAAGQSTQSEGYGVVMVQLSPTHAPIPLAPVYYCPKATTGILSPQCLQLYNRCQAPTHKLFKYLSIICPHQNKEIYLPTTPYTIILTLYHFRSFTFLNKW